MSNILTPKQQRFVEQYIIDLNATQSAIRAGYSEETAGSIGSENLQKPEIRDAISKVLDERSKRTNITQDYVLATIVDTIERCKQARPVLDKKGFPVYVETEDGESLPAYVFDSQAILRGAELLSKHVGGFASKIELAGKEGKDLIPPQAEVSKESVALIVKQVLDEI